MVLGVVKRKLAARFVSDPGDREAYLNQVRTEQVERETPVLFVASDYDEERSQFFEMVRLRQANGERIAILLPKRSQVYGFAQGLRSEGLEVEAPSAHPLVALLISESPFTKSTLLRAQSSPVPFFLLHIPPFPTEHQNEEEPIGSAFWNPALSGTQGLLGGQMEVRWERSIDGQGGGRPGLWWAGRPLRSWTPGSAGADIPS